MTIPINLTEISTFEWSENEKSVTKPPFLEASSRHVAINGTVHKFLQNVAFHENVSSLFFYVRAEMNVHAFMNELD